MADMDHISTDEMKAEIRRRDLVAQRDAVSGVVDTVGALLERLDALPDSEFLPTMEVDWNNHLGGDQVSYQGLKQFLGLFYEMAATRKQVVHEKLQQR